VALLAVERLLHQPPMGSMRLWRHDPASAAFIGALAGLFLNVAGSGSPLLVASLLPPNGKGSTRRAAVPQWTILLFALGETAAGIVWFGIALGTGLLLLPRMAALIIVAAGYGLRRAVAGQDHLLLGAL